MVDGVCWVEQVASICSTPNDDWGHGVSTGNILYFTHAITNGCVCVCGGEIKYVLSAHSQKHSSRFLWTSLIPFAELILHPSVLINSSCNYISSTMSLAVSHCGGRD